MRLVETTLEKELTFGKFVDEFTYFVDVGITYKWGFLQSNGHTTRTWPPEDRKTFGHVRLFNTKKDRDMYIKYKDVGPVKKFKMKKPIVGIKISANSVKWFRVTL